MVQHLQQFVVGLHHFVVHAFEAREHRAHQVLKVLDGLGLHLGEKSRMGSTIGGLVGRGGSVPDPNPRSVGRGVQREGGGGGGGGGLAQCLGGGFRFWGFLIPCFNLSILNIHKSGQGCITREEGGFLNPKICTTIAQINISFCKIHFSHHGIWSRAPPPMVISQSNTFLSRGVQSPFTIHLKWGDIGGHWGTWGENTLCAGP